MQHHLSRVVPLVLSLVTAVACESGEDPLGDIEDRKLAKMFDVVPVCGKECIPELQDCKAGQSCIPTSGGWTCETRTGGGWTADPCEEQTDCDAGFVCVDGSRVKDCSADFCCAGLCEVDDVDVCGGDASCTDVFDFDDDVVGACLLPARPLLPGFSCMSELDEEIEYDNG